jgi:hypothetical protein
MPTVPKQPKSAAEVTGHLNTLPAFLTARQAAPAMGFSESTVSGWMKDGTVETVEFGNRRFIKQAWLRQFMGLPPIGAESVGSDQ